VHCDVVKKSAWFVVIFSHFTAMNNDLTCHLQSVTGSLFSIVDMLPVVELHCP